MRDWTKFENDELMTIWKGYIAQEFGNQDPIRIRLHHDKPIRLTPMEIIQLVEELMKRLDIKENPEIFNDQNIGQLNLK
jgi:hypothetical protein